MMDYSPLLSTINRKSKMMPVAFPAYRLSPCWRTAPSGRRASMCLGGYNRPEEPCEDDYTLVMTNIAMENQCF